METGPYHSLITILVTIGLILLNGFLTSLHTSLISLNGAKLREAAESGDDKAASLFKLVTDQDRLNQSFAMINAFLSLTTLAFLAKRIRDMSLLASFISDSSVLFFTIIAYIIIKIIFVDKIPQRFGVRNPMALSSGASGLARLVILLTSPLVKFTDLITNFIMKIFGIKAKDIQREVTGEQIKSIVIKLMTSPKGESQGNVPHVPSPLSPLHPLFATPSKRLLRRRA